MEEDISATRNPAKVEDVYEMEEIIGEGTFSSVVRATHNSSGKKVAIKIIDKSKIQTPKQLSRLHNEIILHKKAKFPYIVNYLEHFETDIDLCIVLELCGGGELFNKIVEKGCFSEKEASTVVRQIIKAVEYLHSIGIVHRDIKPENLLYSSSEDDSSVKLADFGLAKQLEGNSSAKSGRALLKASLSGTTAYCAPERLSHDQESKAVDMWSTGCISYFLLFGVPPFYSTKEDEEENEDEIFDSVLSAKVLFPENRTISSQAKDLILRLLEKDPAKRMTADQGLLHPWLKKETHSLSEEHQNKTAVVAEQRTNLKNSINRVIDAQSQKTQEGSAN